MATTFDYVEFVCGQIQGVGAARYRKRRTGGCAIWTRRGRMAETNSAGRTMTEGENHGDFGDS